MARLYNFSAGPSALPESVLQAARAEFLDWHGCGMSVTEMSHRGKEFVSIAEKTETDLRALLAIPDNYRVLFLQGGATSQFAMVPMNLLRESRRTVYLCTGSWSQKAIKEAQRYSEVRVAASSVDNGFNGIPEVKTWELDPKADYFHYTSNETIGGVEFDFVPDVGALPLVSDMSSNILSRPVDVRRFGLIYAGAQKNMGPAGVTLVIVRDDLIGRTLPGTPAMFDYQKHADNGSMLNTPPTFNWYLMGLVLEWIKDRGGIVALDKVNGRKAERLYRTIDQSGFYSNPVEISSRSRMNIPFILADSGLDGKFLAEAEIEGLVALKGHRSVGGMRASIYNAMPEEGVDALIGFMAEFERRYG